MGASSESADIAQLLRHASARSVVELDLHKILLSVRRWSCGGDRGTEQLDDNAAQVA